MSSPDFVITRRQAKKILKAFVKGPSQSFQTFHSALGLQDRACLSSLMLLFRKLQLGLENCYFDLPAVIGCFGDEIVIWHEGGLRDALQGIEWPSALALRSLYKSVINTASEANLALWAMEARQFKVDLECPTTAADELSESKTHHSGNQAFKFKARRRFNATRELRLKQLI